MQKLASVIILNYNSNKFVDKLTDSLVNLKGDNFEIIVIDNNSRDGSLEKFEENLKGRKDTKFIRKEDNLGFAKANNIAAREAQGKYLFFINCDLWLAPKVLEILISRAESEKDLAVYAPLQRTYDGQRRISCGMGLDIFGFPSVPGKHEPIFYADGAALFIPKELFWQVGGFDEMTFFSSEDVGVSWRARLLGKQVIQVPEAIVFHWSGGILEGGINKKGARYKTSSRRRFFTERNILRNLLIHYRITTLIFMIPVLLFIHFFEALISLILLGPPAFFVYPKSWCWNLQSSKSIIKWRKLVQHQRTRSDSRVMKHMLFGYAKLRNLKQTGIPKISTS
jgi:GT2 family glycosyltransferase